MKSLADLGERKIIDEVIARFVHTRIGDDCAILNRPAEQIVVTTDPVPPAAAEVIGGDKDLYWKGWLLTTINASDLAASGAEPIALFVAAEAPSDMAVRDLERFLGGVKDACEREGLVYAGGNLREASALSAVGVGVGARRNGSDLGRRGILGGDKLVVVGRGGYFWMDALAYRNGGIVPDKSSSPLFSPVSQGCVMRSLVAENLLVAAMDNSDGLLPSIEELCSKNGVGAVLDLGALPPPVGYNDLRDAIGVSHQRLWLGWGDWNIVAAARPENISTLEQHGKNLGADICVCGEFVSTGEGVVVAAGKSQSAAPRVDSERFARDSWFSTGIEGYIKLLIGAKLPGGL